MNITRWIKKLLLPVKRCSVCGRPLLSKKDRARGMGSSCAKKVKAGTVGTGGAQ